MSDRLGENVESSEERHRQQVLEYGAFVDDLIDDFGEEVSCSVVAAEFDHFLYEEPLSAPRILAPKKEFFSAENSDFHAVPSEVDLHTSEVDELKFANEYVNPFERKVRSEELYATHELNLASLRNEVIFPPQDDLADLESNNPSEFSLHEEREEDGFHVEVTPPLEHADMDIEFGFIRESDDVQFDFDFLEREKRNYPPPPLIDYLKSVDLGGENFDRCIVLPFKVEVTAEDIAAGMTLSTLSTEEKDRVYPIPHKQHEPGVVETCEFLFVRPSKRLSPYIYMIATVVVAVVLVILIETLL